MTICKELTCEVAENDQLRALKNHAGVEAQLQDLIEFMDTIHTSGNKNGTRRSNRSKRVKGEGESSRLKTHGWKRCALEVGGKTGAEN